MGKLYKRGQIYYIDVTANGRRVRKKVGKSKRVAELVLKETELKIERQQYDLDPPDAEIEDLFRQFVEFSEVNHSPNTTKRYVGVLKNFRFFLALKHPKKINLSQLSPGLMEEFKRFRLKTDPRTLELPDDFPFEVKPNSFRGKGRTVNYEIKTLKSIFEFGKKHGLLGKNPCEGVARLRVNDSGQPRFLTKDECQLLLNHSSPVYYPIFFTFLNTGLRLGELINLQWCDISLDRKVLMVREKEDWRPKSGNREVPLNQSMLDLLRSLQPPRTKKRDYVFVRDDGRKFGPKLRQALARTAKRAGLDDVTKIHSLRHTFASHLVMAGVDLPTVQRLLGHTDIQTTMIYAHLAQDHVAEAVKRLEF